MPSKSAFFVLVDAYAHANEAPWHWKPWKERTGVLHGLFPDSDDDLPCGWTRENANDVHSFLHSYKQIPKSKTKEREFFLKRNAHPGRAFFDKWITKCWEKWEIHDVVSNALRDQCCHPFQLMLDDNSLNDFPDVDHHAPKVIDAVARTLFGHEAFPPGSSVLLSLLTNLGLPNSFIVRSWVRLKKQSKSDLKRLEKLEKEARDACSEIDLKDPTRGQILKAITATAKWKALVDIYAIEENVRKVEDVMAALNELLADLGVDTSEPNKVSGRQPPKRQPKKATSSDSTNPTKSILASEEALSEISNFYQEWLNVPDIPPLDEQSNLDISMRDVIDNNAIGMEKEGTMTPTELESSLGLLNGLPLQFNPRRHKLGLNPWDNPKEFTRDTTEPNKSHWHQTAALHSVIRRSTTDDPKQNPVVSGILIADQVGLGKTREIITTIGFWNEVVTRQEQGLELPSIIKHTPYLENGGMMSSLPHLVVVPGTLIQQWISDFKCLFRPNSIDILVYECGRSGNAKFWNKGGAWDQSKQPKHNRIIIVSHTSLRQEFSNTHGPLPKKSMVDVYPWTMPECTAGLENTLFGQRYATVSIDEAHEFRKEGFKFLSALKICQMAGLRLIATGTPLHTQAKDVVSLARLVGNRYLTSAKGDAEVRSDTNALLNKRPSADTDEEGCKPYRQLQIQVARKYQKFLMPNMLRRTAETLDYHGHKLIDLPPLKRISYVVNLTEREQQLIDATTRSNQSNVNAATESGISSARFYIDHRIGSGYAKERPEDPHPKFKSLEEWEPVKSTKMDTVARLCKHYLLHDKIEDPVFVDGIGHYPEPPPVPKGEKPPRTRKILISSAFPSLMGIFKNVLDLYGVKHFYIDGDTPFEKRAAIIKAFNNADYPCVLIFSSIGSIGLNLTCADTVIFIDPPWSSQDVRQVEARAHRQPQKKVVRSIHILIADTADMIINRLACGKSIMYEAFVNKQIGADLAKMLEGKTVYGEDDDEDTQPVAVTRKPSVCRPSTKQKSEGQAKEGEPDRAIQSAPPKVNDKGKGRMEVTPPNPAQGGSLSATYPDAIPALKATRVHTNHENDEGGNGGVMAIKGGKKAPMVKESQKSSAEKGLTMQKGRAKKTMKSQSIPAMSHESEVQQPATFPRTTSIRDLESGLGDDEVEQDDYVMQEPSSPIDTDWNQNASPPIPSPSVPAWRQDAGEYSSGPDMDLDGLPSDDDGMTSPSEGHFSLNQSSTHAIDNDRESSEELVNSRGPPTHALQSNENEDEEEDEDDDFIFPSPCPAERPQMFRPEIASPPRRVSVTTKGKSKASRALSPHLDVPPAKRRRGSVSAGRTKLVTPSIRLGGNSNSRLVPRGGASSANAIPRESSSTRQVSTDMSQMAVPLFDLSKMAYPSNPSTAAPRFDQVAAIEGQVKRRKKANASTSRKTENIWPTAYNNSMDDLSDLLAKTVSPSQDVPPLKTQHWQRRDKNREKEDSRSLSSQMVQAHPGPSKARTSDSMAKLHQWGGDSSTSRNAEDVSLPIPTQGMHRTNPFARKSRIQVGLTGDSQSSSLQAQDRPPHRRTMRLGPGDSTEQGAAERKDKSILRVYKKN